MKSCQMTNSDSCTISLGMQESIPTVVSVSREETHSREVETRLRDSTLETDPFTLVLRVRATKLMPKNSLMRFSVEAHDVDREDLDVERICKCMCS